MDATSNSRVNSRSNSRDKNRSHLLFEKLKRRFYRFLELPEHKNGDVVNIGYTHIKDVPEAFKDQMKRWVARIDARLDQLPQNSLAYADQFSKRGFTYEEYKVARRGDINEEDFKYHRAFDYLFISDRIEHTKFTVSYDDELENFENYLRTLVPYIRREVPVLHSFFFKYKLPIYFPISSLRRHVYLVGKSGSGKSELLKIPFYDLQRRTRKKRSATMILMEPHGDLAAQVLSFVLNKKEGRKRVVFIDPTIRDTVKQVFQKDLLEQEYTFVINPFEISDRSERNINYMVQELGSAFYEILDEDRSAQMKALLNAAIDTLLRRPGSTISDLKRFMDDEQNEDLVSLGKLSPNLEHRAFFQTKWNDKRLGSTKSSIYFKLQSIIGNPQIRRLLVGKSTINLEKEINSGKVLIFNLSKGRMGKEGGPAYGKLMIALIQGIIRKRQDIPPERRKKTFLFIDEFQNYVTPTVEEIMAESRKYALHMFLANQVVGQNMDAQMRRIILGNTTIKIASHNEPDSLEMMSKQMGNIKAKDFDKLPPFSFYLYDSSKPKKGSVLLRSPSFLVNQNSLFYMTKLELADLFKYLVKDSGYYRKSIPLTSPNEIKTGKSLLSEKINSSQTEGVYDPNFKK